jgi:hypothetical protein
MAIAFIQEFTIQDRSTTNYDAISDRVRGGPPAEGLIIHTAGFDDEAGVFRIFDVWETREQAEVFEARVMEIVAEIVPLGTPAPARAASYELHDVVK